MTRSWLQKLLDHPSLTRVVDTLSDRPHVGIEGSWGSSGHLISGIIAQKTKRPVMVLVPHLDDADEVQEDLALFDDLEVMVFPALEVMPGETNVSLELLSDRLEVVTRLMQGKQPDVIVTSVQALMQAVPEEKLIDELVLTLSPGVEIDQDELLKWLSDAGFDRVDVIDQPGDYAVRGGILDIFPPGNMPPVRIDFFGDEIESICEIDLDSMGSDRMIDEVRLIGSSIEKIQDTDHTTHCWGLLNEQTIIVQLELLEIAEQARGYYERVTDARGIYPPNIVQQGLGTHSQVQINQYHQQGGLDAQFEAPVHAMLNFNRESREALTELAELATGTDGTPPKQVVVLCQKSAEKDRLLELLNEHVPHVASIVKVETGYLFRGFMFGAESDQLALIPHHELFHRYQTRRRVRKISTSRAVDGFLDLEPGDYVVHAQHGIALFKSLRMMKKGGEEDSGEEYLTLEFADRVLLHVPVSEIDQVQKYIGGFTGRPKLSKLGGKRWSKQKEEAREGARELAKQMLQLQAARSALPGHPHPPDSVWMKQFEAEFPYQETDDQLAGISAIKKDMESTRPMDRLICGDVGYGKTELAIRGAFKAVEGGKQVAVLCPTTVLCEQHERTFRERMADYPVTIESLSRFKTNKEAAEILERVKKGVVDIVIGTHRLLSKDVGFADLGLVVVDEEQKFGVEHKNRLMNFRMTVDVLTLSATPIPRTLNMALLGLRDISSLSTAPADRRAIVTEVVPYNKKRIRENILRELNRDGQCYFVHNRVKSIYNVEAELRALVPEARIIVGHGQMSSRELEDVMHKFLNHEVDILISTTIIESGIDIPTANTMFINECDLFGLAEMHQLRGRVGRYKHRAYCYLLLPETRPLSEVSSRRLRAIEEYSMLGAGFKIAMRDMEIRGVGNILGHEQSGHIAAVGYEMYCRLLEECTEELKAGKPIHRVETVVDIKLTGHIPKSYIPSDKHRMSGYRRICRASTFPMLDEIEKDLLTAYGEMPKSVEMLLSLSEIRIGLSLSKVDSLKRHENDLIFTTYDVKTLSSVMEGAPGSVRVVETPTDNKPGSVYFRPPEAYLDPQTLPAVLRKMFVRPHREKAESPSLSVV